MQIPFELIILLFTAAVLAGWVDTIAGGGGLITLPALLVTGIPVEVALATNKLQGSCGTLISTSYFIHKKMIVIRECKLMILTTFIGALSGSALVLFLHSSFMEIVLPILIFLAGCYFLFSSQLRDVPGKSRLSYFVFAFFVVPILGFYDGFFGPGTGAFMSLSFISLLGYSALSATAHAKLLNFTSNISALFYFMFSGKIFWWAGFIMFAGQAVGSLIASRKVVTEGIKLIKPTLVLVCFVLSITYIIKAILIK